VLFVFRWLVVGGEETEVRLLAKHLDPARYQIAVVACLRKTHMPEQTHQLLEAMGVPVDRTPYSLSSEDTVEYLASQIPAYDVVVACQAVPEIYPALAPLSHRPPLIEHGGLVDEALMGPKHLTTRYVGVCASIRDAAAARMPGRSQHALEIPSMVDLAEFDPGHRAAVRSEWDIDDGVPVIGWIGRLDRKKRLEDFLRAAALVRREQRQVGFVVIGGPDAWMPEYADELHALAHDLGLDDELRFLGDRPDVPRLMAGLDILVWLSEGEGMPHVIAEAGAACLPVIATRDNGAAQQVTDGISGLFVPHRSPSAAAAAIVRLIRDPCLRQQLGSTLRRKVEREYSATVVARRWASLFDEVIEHPE
jgi:glycosyltransferase involved in cell wall biosynthesis